MDHTHHPIDRRRLLLGAAALGLSVAQLAGVPAARAGDRTDDLAGDPARDPAAGRAGDPAAGLAGDLGPAGAGGHAATLTATRRVGAYEVMALYDAAGPFFTSRQEAFPAASAADWRRAARLDPAAFGPNDAWNLDFRCYAIRRPGGRVILVDTGVGPAGSPASSWAPVPGHLPERLRAAGIAAGDVDLVVLTHVHSDHVGWAVGPDGVPTFPNARYAIQHAEIAALTNAGATTMLSYVVDPLRRTGQLWEVDGRTRLADRPGGAVTAVPTPGHTPGHQSVLVERGRRRLVVTGDVLVHAVQLVNPDVGYVFEDDQDVAGRTRRALLADARRHDALLATAHLKQPFVPARATR
ncbi:MBL fold metallo-hydrolase [Plantactinospora siamensis]|uniref:MBL fold metallo-hydrolase n=1 Tax=Plantactinospora siamensis TaxID=555372 RepID=A0ABV6P0Y4_9ACTN